MKSTSYTARVLRESLTEHGARKIAHIIVPQVGPTLNLIKGNRSVGLDHKVRQVQYAALLQSLPLGPSDPETTMDWEPQQSTIWTHFDSADCMQTIPLNILKSSQLQNVSGLFKKKKR